MHKFRVPWTTVTKKVNTIALLNKKTVLAQMFLPSQCAQSFFAKVAAGY
jgi:hypothetical protein|tara:strand:+ start:1561 stop:1707 length:147 start_codon:yes stop_codon:yes gene_type:complete